MRWLDQSGTREWAVGEVQRRLASKPTPPPVPTAVPPPTPENEDDDAGSVVSTAANVLNTLICMIDEGKFDMDDPDDLADLECQIAPALDIPETAVMSAALLTDLDEYCLTLDDVRLRVDDMLAVLLRLEEEQMEKEPSNTPGCTPDCSLRESGPMTHGLRSEDEMTLEEALKWLDENLVGCG